MRRRVLFVAEAATLAHFARAAELAARLSREDHEILFACPDAYRAWVPDGAAWRPLATQPASRFYARMATGRPLFDLETLRAYARGDQVLLDEVKPDVVVGDIRFSLAVSAREAGVPYFSISNACWDPRTPMPAVTPCLRWSKSIPTPLLPLVAALGRGAVLAWNAAPMAALMREHAMTPPRGIQGVWTEADLSLYADIPALFPQVSDDARHRFLGPLGWAPPTPLPDWWDAVPASRPVAYLTLGSSGQARALGDLAGILAGAGYTVIAATAGRTRVEAHGDRVFTAKYLPGPEACARADLVVGNGGSPGASQALMAGKPVLGVCTNLDQFMNMRAVEAAGAGAILRSDRFDARSVTEAAERLRAPDCAAAAERLRADGLKCDPVGVLTQAIAAFAGR